MKRLFIGALMLVAAGCKSNPYCLNCKDSGNGVIAPLDMTPPVDLALAGDMPPPPDLVGSGGPCAPTNGGVEICDGIDNDCNGKVDDVAQDRLIGDPKNCGACGNECKFNHAFGQCVGGFDGGMPMCKESGCQPGYVDLDGNPANGCEYVCTPTANPTEICDGKDNNCDGRVDEGFTTTWADAQKQLPLYDSDLNDCGQCGVVCSLGPGTVMACQATGAGGRGQCAVTACFNGNDGNGVHQTYRHNPAAGPITATGCEYHCAKPATQINVDCNANGACSFPVETCNGVDDDCDFTADDNLTDPGLNGPCPDGVSGKLCTSTGPSPTCGKGVCAAGTYKCITGGLTCQGSVGPSPDLCDAVDNNCDGKVDEGFTATWSDAGNQLPRYDSDPTHCGGCAAAKQCALPHGANICRLFAGDTLGSCAIQSGNAGCNSGYSWVPKTDSNLANPTCDVSTVGQRDSTQSTPGIGCFYMCPSMPISPEVCDGKDNDCGGCVDDGLTAPPNLCATKGVCAGKTIPTKCGGASGWKCDYTGIPGISLDGAGNLTVTELQCDNLDNNCNGPCDENFPDVAVSTASCTNAGHAATTCKAGLGVCQASGPFTCANSGGGKPYNDIEACAATPNNAAASDEKCNGKDDDCNGLVDEASDFVIGATTFKGWHDPVVQVDIGLDPYTNQAAHTVYVYQYEASRPDAIGTSPGSVSTRACANTGVLPWANVTLAQAQAACASIKNAAGSSIGRLCSAWEWQQTCDGNATPATHWSTSATPTSYTAGVCNDSGETEQRCASAAQCLKSCDGSGRCTCSGNGDCNAGYTCSGGICTGSGAWATGSAGTNAVAQCYVSYASGNAYDLSGNLQEWTSTPVVLKFGTTAKIAATGTPGQWAVTNLANIYSTDVGAQLKLSNSSAGNNGTFTIISVTSATAVVIANPSGAVDAAGTVNWSFIYNKVRGGNFSSTSGGDTCEFDFDIQKATFANADVGFRCCFDAAP